MTPWEEFSKLQKILSGIVGFLAVCITLFGMIYAAYTHFATKAYADSQHTAMKIELTAADQAAEEELHHIENNLVISANRAEIWRAKREIKRLQRERTKDTNDMNDIMMIDADISEYKDLINCIRDNKELCY